MGDGPFSFSGFRGLFVFFFICHRARTRAGVALSRVESSPASAAAMVRGEKGSSIWCALRVGEGLSGLALIGWRLASKEPRTDSWLLHKIRVYCSACADWPRFLQKHKQRATRNNPALSPRQITPGHDAERQLTREKLFHAHSACLSTAARAYSSEKHAPLQSAKRKQLTSGPNFFCYPPTSLPLRLARPTAGLGVGTLFHC